MTDKKEVSILLLGIVAILAIVGLVLLFTSPAATGRAWFPPPLPPDVQTPAPVGVGPVSSGEYFGTVRGQIGNAVIVSELEGANLPRCPNGKLRTREQGNILYEAMPGYYCQWFYCPAYPNVDPVMACVPR